MENTKVLEYPIVITAVGAFIESPSSVRRRAQRLLSGTMNDTSMFESMWSSASAYALLHAGSGGRETREEDRSVYKYLI